MTIRAVIMGVFRYAGLLLAWVAVVVAGLYVFVTSPPGEWVIARVAERQVHAHTDIRLSIGGFRTDLFTYVRVHRTSVTLANDTTQVSLERFQVRLSVLDLLRSRPHAIRRIEASGVRIFVAPSQDEEDTTEAEWSIDPFVDFLPGRINVIDLHAGIVGAADTTSFAIHLAEIVTASSPHDSSVNVTLDAQVSVPGGANLGEIPLGIDAEIRLAGPSVSVPRFALSAPGVAVRGDATLIDAVRGPYRASVETEVDLSELPSIAAGVSLSGTVRAGAAVDWDDSPELGIWAESSSIGTPWLTVRDFVMQSHTSEAGYLVTDISAGLLGGAFTAQTILPVAADDRFFSLDIASERMMLADIAAIPQLRYTMAGLAPEGTIDLAVSASGSFDGETHGVMPFRTSSLNLTGSGIGIGGADIGTASLSANQQGTSLSIEIDALDATLTANGDVYSLDRSLIEVAFRMPAVGTSLRAFGEIDVDGAISADATISGDIRQPDASLVLDYRSPSVMGVTVEDIRLGVELVRADTLRLDLATADSLIVADAQLSRGIAFIDRANLKIGPWLLDKLVPGIAEEYGLAGSFTMNAFATGPVSDPRAKAELTTTPVMFAGQPFRSFGAALDYGSGTLNVAAQNDDRTLEITGSIHTGSVDESRVSVYWNELPLGEILAVLLDQDISRVGGVSEGTIAMSWRDPAVETFAIRARVERVQIHLAGTDYELENPPARFEYIDRELSMPEIRFSGDDQRMIVVGSITRDGDIDIRLQLERISVGNLANVASQQDLGVEGLLHVDLALGGTLDEPAAHASVRANAVRWRSFAIDSAGAQISFDRESLRIPDIHARFPFGSVDGSVYASTSSLGLSTAPDTEPSFEIDLTFDRAGAIIPQWEGLRPGRMSLSGSFNLSGGELSDALSYRGAFQLDSLSILAPFERSLALVEPVTIRFTDRDTLLSRPVRIAQISAGDTLGTISLMQRADASSLGLDLMLETLQLTHLRHVVLPITDMLGVGIPDDIDGTMDVRATWNQRTDAPEVHAGMRINPFTGYGVRVDSVKAQIHADAEALSIQQADIHSAGDIISITGGVGFGADTVGVFVNTDRYELVPVLRSLLPPIKEMVPPAPWPSSVPLPAAQQHVQYLPQSMSGIVAGQPQSAFDRMIRAGHRPAEDGLAATLPMSVRLSYRGSLDDARLNGDVSIPGAYLDLRMITEPIWFLDTLSVHIRDNRAELSDFPISIGPEDRRIVLQRIAYSLDDGEFDFQVWLDQTRATVISAQRVVLPDYLQPFAFLLLPILNAHYTDPVGTFTADAEFLWSGNAHSSSLRGDVELYESVFRYPVPEPQNMLARSRGGATTTVMPNVDMLISVVTRDSLRINNNVTDRATVGFQLVFTGMEQHPRLQGGAEISPGSRFTYLGRTFVIEEAMVTFPDPAVFAPNINIAARSEFYGEGDGMRYRVDISVSGTFPDRIITEMTAYAGEGADQQVIVDQGQIVRLLVFGTSAVGAGARSRFDDYLTARGYAAVSSAVGSVIPLDQVQIQQRVDDPDDFATSDGHRVTEIELGEEFRVFGQRIRVTMATPVGRISQMAYQRAEARWIILERPRKWENLESLSLTVGSEVPDERDGEESTKNENTAEIQIRIRF